MKAGKLLLLSIDGDDNMSIAQQDVLAHLSKHVTAQDCGLECTHLWHAQIELFLQAVTSFGSA